jgi:hypothetical protein
LLQDPLQLQEGDPHLRGGRVLRCLPLCLGEAVLRQVHGHPELHLPQAKDVGPKGVITVYPTYRHAYECDVECIEYAKGLIESKALIVDLENLVNKVSDPKRHSGCFKMTEIVKANPSILTTSMTRH